MPRSLIPVVTPHGSLRLDQADDDFVLESGLADRLEKSFERGSAHGLLHLGTSEAGTVLPASLAWWRDFGMRFIADLCALGDAKGPAGPTCWRSTGARSGRLWRRNSPKADSPSTSS